MQAPAPIVILNGPDLIYELVNPAYQQIFPGRELLGKLVREALAEVAESPVMDILEQVFTTGETDIAHE
jgi:two-component system, sensor histidine kinase